MVNYKPEKEQKIGRILSDIFVDWTTVLSILSRSEWIGFSY